MAPRPMMAPLPIEIRKQNIDTMNAISVDVEIIEKLKKAKLENGFYNLIDGERVSAGKTLSVVNPATGNQLAMVPDIDRVLLKVTSQEAQVRLVSAQYVTASAEEKQAETQVQQAE